MKLDVIHKLKFV